MTESALATARQTGQTHRPSTSGPLRSDRPKAALQSFGVAMGAMTRPVPLLHSSGARSGAERVSPMIHRDPRWRSGEMPNGCTPSATHWTLVYQRHPASQELPMPHRAPCVTRRRDNQARLVKCDNRKET
jgi:hypothetical protein